MIHSHERRALGALVSLFSRSEPAPSPRRPTASYSLVAVRRVDYVHATWLYFFIVQRIDRYSYSYFFMCLVLLLYVAGSGPLEFHLALVAKINIIIREQSKQTSCAEMVLGSFFFLLL